MLQMHARGPAHRAVRSECSGTDLFGEAGSSSPSCPVAICDATSFCDARTAWRVRMWLPSSASTTHGWQVASRFLKDRCEGLFDEARPGRSRTIDDDQVAAVIGRSLRTTRRRDALVDPLDGGRNWPFHTTTSTDVGSFRLVATLLPSRMMCTARSSETAAIPP